ncbi:hypothetical protein GCM10022225_23410 [Plantactinospora mayteni]|uniref:Uncharacterized protein n=1 Tax=Plantactinospora mayteni TaxID=566021 RepID=A0ABQ4EPG4_9ACTN|nr:hypothetical protein Pma05_30980 [Plantactinospora mayteni]
MVVGGQRGPDKGARPDRLPRGKRAIGARTKELNHPGSVAQRVVSGQISDRRTAEHNGRMGQSPGTGIQTARSALSAGSAGRASDRPWPTGRRSEPIAGHRRAIARTLGIL